MTDTDKSIIYRIDTLEEKVDDKLSQIHESLDRLNHFIEGNGQPGLKVRLDRLEQSESRRNWTIKAIAGTLLGSIVTALWSLIAK